MERRTALFFFLISLFVIAILLPRATVATPTRTSNHALAPRDIIEPSNLPRGHNDTVVCVFPISGQYGLLPRVLYYVTLVFAIVGRHQTWLVLGALASALSYAGAASIHMIALVGSNKKPIYDLDILPVWAILTTGCLAFAALVNWSSTIRQSNSRVVFILWGALVGAGCLTGRGLLLDADSISEPACRSSKNGALLTNEFELLDPQFNCTYNCFGSKVPMRNFSELQAIPSNLLRGKFSAFVYVLMAPVLTAAHKSVSIDFRPHSPSERCRRLVMGYLDNSLNARLSQHVYDSACSTWYGGYFLLLQYSYRAKFRSNFKRRLGVIVLCPLVLLELFLDMATPPIFVGNIIFNELKLINPQLPTEEGVASVGQWSPVVSAILVVIASIIDRSIEWYGDRKRMNKSQESQEEAHQLPDGDTCRSRLMLLVMSFLRGSLGSFLDRRRQ